MKGDFKLRINISVNTENLKLEEKKVLRNKLQKLVDTLTGEIKHQYITNYKHKK